MTIYLRVLFFWQWLRSGEMRGMMGFILEVFELKWLRIQGTWREVDPEQVAIECLGGGALSNQQEVWKSGGFPGHASWKCRGCWSCCQTGFQHLKDEKLRATGLEQRPLLRHLGFESCTVMSMSHLGNFRKAVLFQMFGYKNKIWGYNYDPCSIDSEAAVKPLQQILLQYSG